MLLTTSTTTVLCPFCGLASTRNRLASSGSLMGPLLVAGTLHCCLSVYGCSSHADESARTQRHVPPQDFMLHALSIITLPIYTSWRISSSSRVGSFEGVCIPLPLMNYLFPVPDSQPMATELFQSPLYGSGAVFHSISHLLRHFPSSAVVWRHTSSNSVTCNYCCHAHEVTLSFMDTLIALTYFLLYLGPAHSK